MDEQKDRCEDRKRHGWIDRQRDRWTDGQTNGWMNKQTKEEHEYRQIDR